MTASNPSLNYNQNRICDDALETKTDYGKNEHLTHFAIRLQEGCWSGWVIVPTWWHTWNYQLNTSDAWIAGWPSGMNPSGPFRQGQNFSFCSYCPSGGMRYQGKGTVTVYTNVQKSPRTEFEEWRDGKPKAEQSDKNIPEIKPGPPPHETKSPPGTKKEIEQMFFTLGECRLNGDYLTCQYEVTNQGKERNLAVYLRSRVFDSTGHEHGLSRATIGAENIRFTSVDNKMPTDVPIACTVSFSQVPADSTEIRLLEFETNLRRNDGDDKLKFYGVPVSK